MGGPFALPMASLCRIRGGKAKCYDEDGSLGHSVESIYEDHAGNVWAGDGTGLWQWQAAPKGSTLRSSDEVAESRPSEGGVCSEAASVGRTVKLDRGYRGLRGTAPTRCPDRVQERNEIGEAELFVAVRRLHKERPDAPCLLMPIMMDAIEQLNRRTIVEDLASDFEAG